MYDEIVKKYYGIIYNYCRQRLNFSKTAAEDVTQEVSKRAWHISACRK